MKHFFLIIHVLAFSLSISNSAERTWLSTSGKTFDATFTAIKGKQIAITNKNGKKGAFSIKNLSIADRHFLHTNHDISLDLLSGSVSSSADHFIKASKQLIRASGTHTLSGENFSLKLKVFESPHFIILHTDKIKVAPFAETLERVWFSHACGTPGFLNATGGKRFAYFFISEGHDLDALGHYHVSSLKEHQKKGRKLSQILSSWTYSASSTPIRIPDEIINKYNTFSTGGIEASKFDKSASASVNSGIAFHEWQNLLRIGFNLSPFENKGGEMEENAQAFVALKYANETRLNKGENLVTPSLKKVKNALKIMPQGKTKKWGKELAKKVKDDVVKASFTELYTSKSKISKDVKREEYLNFGQLLMAAGGFMEQDFQHTMGKAKYLEFVIKEKRYPSLDELPALFNYNSVAALDQAFEKFVMKKNMKR